VPTATGVILEQGQLELLKMMIIKEVVKLPPLDLTSCCQGQNVTDLEGSFITIDADNDFEVVLFILSSCCSLSFVVLVVNKVRESSKN
jgi:hypothetical protein